VKSASFATILVIVGGGRDFASQMRLTVVTSEDRHKCNKRPEITLAPSALRRLSGPTKPSDIKTLASQIDRELQVSERKHCVTSIPLFIN
jgi:hypothetical protein